VYSAHWGLSGPPFQNVPDPRFFCPLPAHQEILAKLVYVVESGKGGALLTGEAGCGKSTLSRTFVVQLDAERYDVGLVLNPSLPSDELLYEITAQLGVSPATPDRAALLRALNDHLLASAQRGKVTVLILDEVHTIKDENTFHDLRMLLNVQLNDRQPVTLILLGQPGMREVIARHRSLDQRLALRLNLGPLSEAETALYIDFRLKKVGGTRRLFTDDAIRMIHGETAGIPLSINNLCDLCLYEGSKRMAQEVDATLVKEALVYV